MFNLSNGNLFYNGFFVESNGEEFKGNFIALIFNTTYCYIVRKEDQIDSVILDYIQCNSILNFDVTIKNINI